MIRWSSGGGTGALLLLVFVAACGGGVDPLGSPTSSRSTGEGDASDAIALRSRVQTTVLRPGESEEVEFLGDAELPEDGLDVRWEYGSGGLELSRARVCARADPRCEARTVTAADPVSAPVLALLGYRVAPPEPAPHPVSVFPSTATRAPPVVAVDGGSDFSVAVDVEGSLWSWGGAAFGRLGTPAFGPRAQPSRVPGAFGMVAVAAGRAHVLALDEDGVVWSWGLNGEGQLGLGDRENRDEPTRVVGLPPIRAIAAGFFFSLAVDVGGNLWGWGYNGSDPESSRLPGVIEGNTSVPVMLTGLSDVVAVAAGSGHALALDTSGRVWAWGQGPAAGRCEPQAAPVQVLDRAVAVSAGSDFSLVLRDDGRVHAFGRNPVLQLGRAGPPSCAGRGAPLRADEPVPGLDGVVQIEAGDGFALARRRDGTVWGWGANDRGQLAALPSSALHPGPVLLVERAVRLGAGSDHVLALTEDALCGSASGRPAGRLLAWGGNEWGQRGDGTGANWPGATPVLALGDSDACDRSLGHRLILYRGGAGRGTITSSEPGLRCAGMICWQSLPPGTVVTLETVPAAGSAFGGWAWDCPGNAFTATSGFVLREPRVCKTRLRLPREARQYRLTVELDGEGSVGVEPGGGSCDAGPCTYPFDDGTEVSLTATPGTDHLFHRFDGGPGCEEGRVVLDADTRCVARFLPLAEYGERQVIELTGAGRVTDGDRVVCESTGPTVTCEPLYRSDILLTLVVEPVDPGATVTWMEGRSGRPIPGGTVRVVPGLQTVYVRIEEPVASGPDGTYRGALTFAAGDSNANLLDLPDYVSYAIDVSVSGDTISLSAAGAFVDVSGRWDPATGAFSDLSNVGTGGLRIRADGSLTASGGVRTLRFTYVVADDTAGLGSIYRFEGTDP
jgi:alpha-tubulin suppressor-like RCC1 family protein